MLFRISVVKTVALLLLSVCSNNAVNLRGQANPAATGQMPALNQQANPLLNQAANGQPAPYFNQDAIGMAAGSYLSNAARSLGADQALAALGEHVSLQKRIVLSMQNLNQKMASLAMKNDQLQRLEADDQLNRLSAIPPEAADVAGNSRFQSAPPVGTLPAISLMHPVMPVGNTMMPAMMPGGGMMPAGSNAQFPNASMPMTNNPIAWMSYNSFGGANIPLPQPHVTNFMGGHSLGYPIQPGSATRNVGLPGPTPFPQIAQLPPYGLNMVSGSPFYDQRGFPSSVYQVPGAANNGMPNTMLPMLQGAHMAHPLWMSAKGYPLLNPPLVYPPHGALASPYAGVPGLSPAFAGGFHGLPLDAMGYPVTILGLNSPPPPPSGAPGAGSGSGVKKF